MRNKHLDYIGGHSLLYGSPKAKGSWEGVYGPHDEKETEVDTDSPKRKAAIALMDAEDQEKRRRRRKESEAWRRKSK